MQRRSFLRVLGLAGAASVGVAAGVVDPERLLWVPGKFFLPSAPTLPWGLWDNIELPGLELAMSEWANAEHWLNAEIPFWPLRAVTFDNRLAVECIKPYTIQESVNDFFAIHSVLHRKRPSLQVQSADWRDLGVGWRRVVEEDYGVICGVGEPY